MPVYKINVKWQKEKFNDLECNTDETPEIFKAMLFSLSGVPPERQTIMMPGGTLKDSWKNIKLKDGMTVMMMGSSEKLLDKVTEIEKPKFIEDMTEGQITQALKLPQGLQNIGNTCYLNATLQCFRSISELNAAIKNASNQMNNTESQRIESMVNQIGLLFTKMDSAQTAINPMFVLKYLHEIYPQFATTQNLPSEKGGGSILMQQDANECYMEILRCFQKTLQMPQFNETNLSSVPESFGKSGGWNFVEQFMTGKLTVKTVNTESESEVSTSEESFMQLSCFIDKDVKYLHTGIRNGFEGTLTKMSEALGRDSLFKRSSRVSRLPAYISVQFIRFYYKERENINAKVLKDVKFPMSLDMFEFCSDDLQKRLLGMRENYKTMEDRLAQEEKVHKNNPEAQTSGTSKVKYHPYWFNDDIGSNNSGLYELQAVLTHQGRSSSSGHYVGWVKREIESGKESCWLKYDDDYVTQVNGDDILRLSGGGDWHCAYVLLYGPKRIEIAPNESGANNGDIDEKAGEPMDVGQ